MVIGLGLFVFAMLLASTLSIGFQPTQNRDYAYIAIEGAPGADRGDMEAAVQKATRVLMKDPDTAQVFSQVGSTSGSLIGGGSDLLTGTLTIVLRRARSGTSEAYQPRVAPKLRCR